jgi:DNA-binding FadR family transcriptional regulator
LARLAQEELLVARQGSGHTVRDYREAGGAALIPTLLDQLETPELRLRALEDLLEVRRHLARLVFARLLSRVERERRTARLEDALTAIETAIEAMAALPGDAPPAAIASADAAIIRALCAATDRPVLPLLVSPTVALVHASPPLRDAIYREPESHAAGWRQALAALRGRAALPASDSPPGPILDALESLMARRDAITLARIAGRDTVPSTTPNDATPAPTPRRRAR